MRQALFFIIVLATLLNACKKAEDRRCFKTAGDDATLEVPLGNFGRLDLGARINYILVQDTVNKVVLSGGRHLISMIRLEIVDGDLLVIENRNTCSFLRSYKKEVTAEVHVTSIYNVSFKGTRDLNCANTIKSDYFTFFTLEASGTCNLNIEGKYCTIVCGKWGNFNLSGTTNYLKLEMRENAFGDATNIQVNDSLNVISYSSELTKISANNIQLRAEVSSSGDIWYLGNPASIEYNQYGSGALVDKN